MFEGYLRKFLRNQHQNHTMCLTHLFEISTHLAPHVYYTRSTTRLGFVGLEDSWPFEPNVLAKRTPQESSMPTFEVGLGGVRGGGREEVFLAEMILSKKNASIEIATGRIFMMKMQK